MEEVSSINCKESILLPSGEVADSCEEQDLYSSAGDEPRFDERNGEDDSKQNGTGKPLSFILPEKYKDTDPKELFPEFREGERLRFQRLFEPRKDPRSQTVIWNRVSRTKKNAPNDASEVRRQSSPLHVQQESDEEVKFTRREQEIKSPKRQKKVNNGWRFGPAKLWYDVLGLPEDAETCDYGFKLKDPESVQEDREVSDPLIPDDAYLMVTQRSWEDDVIWDGDDIKSEVEKKMNNLPNPAGWSPTEADRTLYAFYKRAAPNFDTEPETLGPAPLDSFQVNNALAIQRTKAIKCLLNGSLFPVESKKLRDYRWEDDVIWDSEAMDFIPTPPVTFVKSDDEDDVTMDIGGGSLPEVNPLAKCTAGRKILNDKEDNSSEDDGPQKEDFYNISNDEYYSAKSSEDAALKPNNSGTLVQHSTPALELRSPYFPTHLGPQKLRDLHRAPLKRYSHGSLSFPSRHGVHSVHRHAELKSKQRQRELSEAGGGDMFFMREEADLSAKDGELVLFEYSEQHPPLMMQVGMASKIRNYYKRKPGKDLGDVSYKYGEFAYAHTSPFLGSLQPGQCLQALENNMFRSPIFEHDVEDTDFLIIRTRQKYYIRKVEIVYAVGQQLPFLEVFAPRSASAKAFIKDFLMVYFYRESANNSDNSRRIKMEEIKNAFPTVTEGVIRYTLKNCADFHKIGHKRLVQKTHLRLPSEEEIRKLVSPEQCCVYYSMLAAEQRLKDAGYGDKYLITEEENDDSQAKIDDEVKAASWNTTKAFISAVKGNCYLQLTGVADPTGCGEGFSYVKASNKPHSFKEQDKKLLMKSGTDSDLRRLSLIKAKRILSEFRVPEHEMKKLSRWQVVDLVRRLSTQKARSGVTSAIKYARKSSADSVSEHQKKYEDECQRLFNLQNKILTSKEPITTDEDSSSDGESDLEEIGKHMESIILNRKTAEQLTVECEEAERKDLVKTVLDGNQDSAREKEKIAYSAEDLEGKIMKIFRTYRNADGTEYVRVETVRKPAVIELYTKIKRTKSDEFIKHYALEREVKVKLRREKNLIQAKLRRLNRKRVKKEPKECVKALSKVKCGACGAPGHMRTNKTCPAYQPSPTLTPVQVAMTVEQEEAEEKTGLDDDNLVKVDETKLILSKQLVQHADELRRKSLLLKIPKSAVSLRKKRKTVESPSLFSSTPKLANRKRIDPAVSIGIVFENIINEIKNLPNTQPFWYPVSAKEAPNYYAFIHQPMDLQSMRERIRRHEYKSRESFLDDVEQILENCQLYNGKENFLSKIAQEMLNHCVRRFSEEEGRLAFLEKAINPLLDNERVAFSFILESIVNERLKMVRDSWPFHRPVDEKTAKGYYEIIKQPMDLDAIVKNCRAHSYVSREAFLGDVQLLHSNSVCYNGESDRLSEIAKEIVDVCRSALERYDAELAKYESCLTELPKAYSNDDNALFVAKKRKTDPDTSLSRLNATSGSSQKYPDSEADDSSMDIERSHRIVEEYDLQTSSPLYSDDCKPVNDTSVFGKVLDEPISRALSVSLSSFVSNEKTADSFALSSPSSFHITNGNNLNKSVHAVKSISPLDGVAKASIPSIDYDKDLQEGNVSVGESSRLSSDEYTNEPFPEYDSDDSYDGLTF